MEHLIKAMHDNYHDTKMALPTLSGCIMVSWKNISHLRSEDNYCELYTTDNKRYQITKSLKWMEEKLKETCFYRVHKSYLVNIYHMLEYQRTGNGCLVMVSGCKLPISRTAKKEICKIFKY